MRTLRNRITCGECGGDAFLKHGDYTEDGKTYHNFPYWKCTQCGEVWYDFDALLKIEQEEAKGEHKMMRKEYCEKDGILITYTDQDVAFEDVKTAEAIIFSNDGSIKHNDFFLDEEKTKRFQTIFARIYKSIMLFRSLDTMEEIA